jgi:hypothetical protein
MRRKRITKWIAVLAALALPLWLASPSNAESGCHKTKTKPGDTSAVQVDPVAPDNS